MYLNKLTWDERNPERVKEIKRKSWHKNKEKNREYKKRWFSENFEKKLLSLAKSTSKKRGLDFDLELSDIQIPDICPYLEIPLDREIYKGRVDGRASIDRIDPSKGYVKGNVQVISYKANRMKNDASTEELKIFARNILKNVH